MSQVNIGEAVQNLQKVRASLNASFFERERHIRILLVALLSKEHAALLGPPGTGKSALCTSVAESFISDTGKGLSFFSLQGSATTMPEDLLGPINLPLLSQGKWERLTTGRVPDSELVFLDEGFKIPAPILNVLLKIMNERLFENGGVNHRVPLMTLVVAANELPGQVRGGNISGEAAPTWDRFMLRDEVPYLSHTGWKDLMTQTQPSTPYKMQRAELLALQGTVSKIPIPSWLFDMLETLKLKLLPQGIQVSDRRWKKSLTLIRSAALIEGRSIIEEDDVDILQHVLWSTPDDMKVVVKEVQNLANPYLAKYLDSVDEAVSVYNTAMEQKSKLKGRERAEVVLEAWGKIAETKEDLESSEHRIGSNAKAIAAKQRFTAIYDAIVKQVH